MHIICGLNRLPFINLQGLFEHTEVLWRFSSDVVILTAVFQCFKKSLQLATNVRKNHFSEAFHKLFCSYSFLQTEFRITVFQTDKQSLI